MNMADLVHKLIGKDCTMIEYKTELINATFPEKAKEIVKVAKQVDAKYCIFGSEKHKYTFNDVASMEQVRTFEEKYNIKLPQAYVDFLTQVGNGGAGPDYGLYSLEHIDKYENEYLHQENSNDVFLNTNLTVEGWKKTIEKLDETDDDQTYYDMMRKIMNGAIVIGTRGCTYDYLLMCKGNHKGKIVLWDWNMIDDTPPIFCNDTFEEWYLEYFHKIITDQTHPITSKIKGVNL